MQNHVERHILYIYIFTYIIYIIFLHILYFGKPSRAPRPHPHRIAAWIGSSNLWPWRDKAGSETGRIGLGEGFGFYKIPLLLELSRLSGGGAADLWH